MPDNTWYSMWCVDKLHPDLQTILDKHIAKHKAVYPIEVHINPKDEYPILEGVQIEKDFSVLPNNVLVKI